MANFSKYADENARRKACTHRSSFGGTANKEMIEVTKSFLCVALRRNRAYSASL